MIWFNLKQLENKLSDNQVTDKECFTYVLAFCLLSFFVGNIYISTTIELSSRMQLIYLLMGLAVTVIGVKAIFNTNDERDGRDLFKRFFAITWVVGFRYFVLIVVLYVPISLLSTIFSGARFVITILK